jgi:hypothetical protein
MITTDIYVYHWYICLLLVHMITTGIHVYHWHICLPLVHMVTTVLLRLAFVLNLLFLIKFYSHWIPCKMLKVIRRYEMSKKTVLLVGTFLTAEFTVVGIRAERLLMSHR